MSSSACRVGVSNLLALLAALLGTGAFGQVDGPSDSSKPPPLLLQALREQWPQYGRVELRAATAEQRWEPQIIRHQWTPGERFFSTQAMFRESSPAAEVAPYFESTLDANGRRWNSQNALIVNVQDLPADGQALRRLDDPAHWLHARGLGLTPLSLSSAEPTAVDLLRIKGERRYEQNEEGGLTKVVAIERHQEGVRQIVWWIDRAKGSSVVRVQELLDGRLLVEAVSELARQDGFWYPRRVEYFQSGFAGGRRAYQTVDVVRAQFEDPNLPTALTPENTLNVCDGTNIKYGGSHYIYVNGQWEPGDTAAERYARGEWRHGQAWLDARDLDNRRKAALGIPPGTRPNLTRPNLKRPPLPPQSTSWQRYVRGFIGYYDLTEEQAQAAWRIHDTCREKADEYLQSRSKQIAELDEKTKVATDPIEKERLRAERQELLAPVDDIFERQLKPRLDNLPTREQRERVEHTERAAAAATQPSRPSSSP